MFSEVFTAITEITDRVCTKGNVVGSLGEKAADRKEMKIIDSF